MHPFPSRLLILGLGDTLIGVVFATGASSRTSSRAYASAKQIGPIHTWGWALCLIGLLILLGIALHQLVTPSISRPVIVILATFGAMWCAFWAAELWNTANADQRVSYSGALLWLCFGTIPHLFLAFGREG